MRWDIDLTDCYAGPNIVRQKQWDYIAKALGPTIATGPRVLEPGEDYKGNGYTRMGPTYANPERAARIAATEALLAQRRKPAPYRKAKGVTPCPVYVATYRDGTERRLSFWTQGGKPIDYAQGYNVALVIAGEAPVSGHVEIGDKALADPFFADAIMPVKVRKDSAAVRLAAIVRALNEGEIDAALIMARAA